MTTEEKIRAAEELKNELLRQLKVNNEEIVQTQKLVFEHKSNVQQMKNELSSKLDLVLE